MDTRATIFVRFTVGGFHRWPDAPAWRSYLRARHRHLFFVEVRLDVRHDDREVEFHDLLASACAKFEELGEVDADTGIHDFGSASCEALARLLAGRFDRPVQVSVSEDNEAGAIVATTGER